MTTTSTKVVIGGVPTSPEVKRLLAAFPDPQPGTTISHADIETVLNLSRDSSRYRTIITAWRRQLLLEQNIDIDALSGVGFYVPAPFERVTISTRDFRRGIGRVGKAVRRISRVPMERLTNEEQVKAEHTRRRMEATLSEGRSATKEIAIRLAPLEQSPRVRPSITSSSESNKSNSTK